MLYRTFFLAFFVGHAFPTALIAVETPAGAPKQLIVYPPSIKLLGPGDEQRLIVVGVWADDRKWDLTTTAKYTPANSKYLTAEKGIVRAYTDCSTTVAIEALGAKTSIPVIAEKMTADIPVGFTREIEPILTKAGCNSGACHGASLGRGGFRLSLFAFDPAFDHSQIVQSNKGRRIVPNDPERSILLAKPALIVEHAGGERLKLNSRHYNLIRQWLENGAPAPDLKDPIVERLEIFPPTRIMQPGEQQQLAITAIWSDGKSEDVTTTAQFDALNDSVASTTPTGLITAKTAGETHIMVRFGGQAGITQVTLPFARLDKYPEVATNNFIDLKLLPIGPLPPVAAVSFSPDGKLLASGTYGRVTVWDLTTAKPVKLLTNVLGAVNALKFSPDGKLLAVAGGQPSIRGDLRLFDTSDWKLIHSLGGHLDTVSGIDFTPDNAKIASASFDKTVRVWDVKNGKLIHTYTGHSDSVYAVAFSHHGTWFATASKDRTGRIVETASGKGLLTLSGTDQEVMAVAIRPDGQQVVTGGMETQLSWWDSKTAERVKRTAGPGVAVHELAFDQKGTVAVAGGDGTVRFYKPSGDLINAAQAGSMTFTVALDSLGKRAASGGADGTVKLWAVAEARLLATFWSGSDDAWLSLTPEGYFTGTETLLSKATWKASGKPVADAKLLTPLNDPIQVGKAAQGQKPIDHVWK